MLFRFFIYANAENEARYIYTECIKDIKDNIVNDFYDLIIKPYWKISGIYVLEISIELNIEKGSFWRFLESMSDSWLKFGSTLADELLASETSEGCKYMKKGLSMVNIFFEEREVYLV